MKIAILMTCHNRRDFTLRCLKSLGEWTNCDIAKIFLVDDGSDDGTAQMVNEQFPNIMLLRTNGNYYWARGMEIAWRKAIETDDYDGYLWLNDDVVLNAGVLTDLLCTHAADKDAIQVGELMNAKGEVTYGKRGNLFTGNFLFVPKSVYKKVGLICGEFHHAWADSDYAMRCYRAGVKVVSCGVVGTCEGHSNRPSLIGLSLRERWLSLWEPKGWCVHDLWLYRKRNWGYCAAIWSSIHLIFHACFTNK